jgi:hypothetical protein
MYGIPFRTTISTETRGIEDIVDYLPLSPPRERVACAAGRVRGQFPLSPPRERVG